VFSRRYRGRRNRLAAEIILAIDFENFLIHIYYSFSKQKGPKHLCLEPLDKSLFRVSSGGVSEQSPLKSKE
jgi:hypothetical protein